MITIISAVIGGLAVAVPSIISTLLANKSNSVLTNYKLEELTKEVREHNNFARRMPIVEEKVKNIEKEVEELKRK